MKNFYCKLLSVVLTAVIGSSSIFGQLIKTTPVSTAVVGAQYVYDVNIYKLGVADSAFYLDEKPAGMSINATTGLITWTPENMNQGGKVIVRVTAGTFSDSQTFYVYITDAVICDEQMVSYWKLDETSGTVFSDFKGGFNAMTSVAPKDTIGIVGRAKVFNPTLDQRLSVTNSAGQYDWNAGDDISVSFWFKSRVDINTQTGPQVILGRLGTSGSTTNKHWWWVGLDTNNYVSVNLSNVGTIDETINNQIEAKSSSGVHYNDDIWHHVVFTFEGIPSNFYTLKLYVDGILKRSVNKQFEAGNFVSSADLNIGWWQNPWGSKYFEFDGALDEIAFYKKSLTLEEIQNMYDSGLDGKAYCQPGNYAPLFKSSPILNASEDIAYVYNIETDDFDDQPLTVEVVSGPTWLSSFTDNGNGTAKLSGTPRNNDVGNHNVTLKVSDGQVSIEQIFVISVANVNDAPVFTSTAITQAEEDANYTYNITTSDVDAGASMTITSVSTLPTWLTLVDHGNGSATLSGIPTNQDVGTVNITLRVTDNNSANTDQSFALQVNNVNDSPVISGQVDLSINEDENLVISLNQLMVTDIDNNYPADFSLEILEGEDYTFSGLTVIPNADFFGTLTVNILLSDLAASVEGTLEIEVVSVNDVPVIITEPVLTATAGTAYEYWVEAVDVEDEVLTFEALTLPSWASFSYNTSLKLGLLQGTPSSTDAATANVSIKVTDSDGDSDIQDFVIEVSGVTPVSNVEASDFLTIYPSPVKNILHIQAVNESFEGSFEILTLSGVKIKEVRLNKQMSSDINVSELNSGVYFYRYTTKKGHIIIDKFLKD